jgi:hypothetical protein
MQTLILRFKERSAFGSGGHQQLSYRIQVPELTKKYHLAMKRFIKYLKIIILENISMDAKHLLIVYNKK